MDGEAGRIAKTASLLPATLAGAGLLPATLAGASGDKLGSYRRLSENTAGLERPQGPRAEKFPEAVLKSQTEHQSKITVFSFE